MFNLEIEIKYMIKNNTLQVNCTNNFVKKTNMLKFGYGLAVATMLATTIQSCGSSVGYKINNPTASSSMAADDAEAERLAALDIAAEALAARILAAEEEKEKREQEEKAKREAART